MKKRSVKKTWNIISTVLVALVVLLALLLVGARIFGLQVFTVLSGSMEPTYHTGSLIYVKKVDPYTIQNGQVALSMMAKPVVEVTARVLKSPFHSDSPQAEHSPEDFRPAARKRVITTAEIV